MGEDEFGVGVEVGRQWGGRGCIRGWEFEPGWLDERLGVCWMELMDG